MSDDNKLLQKDPGQTTLFIFGEQLVLNTSTGAVTRTRFISLPDGGAAVRTGAGTNYWFELTLRLFWSSADRSFDLDQPSMREWLYQTVLREASRPDDLTGFLDRDTLISIWPDLRLPAGVRQAWEEMHPVLRAPAIHG